MNQEVSVRGVDIECGGVWDGGSNVEVTGN